MRVDLLKREEDPLQQRRSLFDAISLLSQLITHLMMLRLYKSVLVSFVLGAFLAVGLQRAHAQDRGNTLPRVSPNASVSQTIGVTEVEISYGRPSVRGRTIYGDLVPYGEIWRTGANEATTISFSSPVQIEGESLEAGTYALFTIPGQDTWSIIFNENPDQWGAYEHDPSEDVLEVEVPPESADMREMLTFTFHNVTDTSATSVLHWAETRVPFQITVNTPQVLQARAEEAISGGDDWQTPLRFASYALENDVLTEEALQWVDQSIDREERFENLAIKARLLATQGSYDEAITTAEAALSQAEERDEMPNGMQELEQQVKEWESQM